ncbi:hypothetical protein [Infirmifilum sp. NZ]|nr:hypothetical protein [Infirmifilum sp. NZ]UNQ73169.1 hypothetical protein MOV14_08660 [Infirmifilum sp. NZ]
MSLVPGAGAITKWFARRGAIYPRLVIEFLKAASMRFGHLRGLSLRL